MKILLMLTMVFSLNLYAQNFPFPVENGYVVTNVVQEGDLLKISYQTKATMNSMCYMKTKALKLVKGKESFDPTFSEPGKIQITSSVDPSSMCLMAFGPHRGYIEFNLGEQLPKLDKGIYQLTINGELQEQAIVVK
jgi:hypothetical protein